MRRTKPFIGKFRADPYRRTILVFDDAEKMLAYVTKALKPDPVEPFAEWGGITQTDWKNGAIYIGVFDNWVNTVMHESVHAAVQILDAAGVKLDPKNDEPLRYLAGFIADRVNATLQSARK